MKNMSQLSVMPGAIRDHSIELFKSGRLITNTEKHDNEKNFIKDNFGNMDDNIAGDILGLIEAEEDAYIHVYVLRLVLQRYQRDRDQTGNLIRNKGCSAGTGNIREKPDGGSFLGPSCRKGGTGRILPMQE